MAAVVFADPQVQHRGMRFDMSHPAAGTVPLIANPIRFSDTPIQPRLGPPLLGQHSEEVLRELLKLDNADIRQLVTDGIVRVGKAG